MAAIRSADVAKLRDDWLKVANPPLKPATVLRRLALLSHVFNIARKEWGMESLVNPLDGLSSHYNLKATFAKARKIKQVGMKTVLEIVGLPLSGSHHRALDDALNIARLLPEAWGK